MTVLDAGDKTELRALVDELKADIANRQKRPSWTAVLGAVGASIALTFTVAALFVQVGGRNEQINTLDGKISQLITKVDDNVKLTEARISDLQKADQTSLVDRNDAKSDIRHLQETDRATALRITTLENAVVAVNASLTDIKIQLVTIATQITRNFTELDRRIPGTAPKELLRR